MSFAAHFGFDPQAEAAAPGRVNLLGEHTDYNDGFVLPTVIPQQTHAAVALSKDGCHHVASEQYPETVTCEPGQLPEAGFARYVFGCLAAARDAGYRVPLVTVYVRSDVPIGVGLSSSAALSVAVLRALRLLLDWSLEDVELARLAQQAEVRYAGVHCGIMDQMAASVGRPGYMLALDTRSLDRTLVPLPPHSALAVLDSGEPRQLAASGYNERRAQCAAAARALGVAALRDLTDPMLASTLPGPLDRRARHVVTENARVLEALKAPDARTFGALMNESHRSLRDDFEVSTPALDLLTSLLQQQPGVYGARLTGAGFGGACVALLAPESRDSVCRNALAAYAAQGHAGQLLV